MRLSKFRVQNYKKVRDTGWVSCRDLTVLVGKNEAGKSAVFRGLSKLNPSDGERYDGLKEFPRRRYSDEFAKQDWPVASAVFVLSDEDREALAEVSEDLAGCTQVTCTRHYSWTLTVDFEGVPAAAAPRGREFSRSIQEAVKKLQSLTAPDGKGEEFGPKKAALLAIQGLASQVQPTAEVPKALLDQAVNTVAGQITESWLSELLTPVLEPLQRLASGAELAGAHAAARSWIAEHMAKFIYFDRYDVIDSAIYIPDFLGQVQPNAANKRARVTHCLFRHVGLDVAKLAQLGRHQPGQGNNPEVQRQIDERTIISSSAGNAMTRKFSDWWEQRKHRFSYKVDGDYFRIWVSDDLDESEIELDQRSAGMQYFFSFFVVFLVESEDAHRDSILLLDEPGVHLHGTAQGKIVQFLRKLSKDNQTLYSTHSPFMIDGDHLEEAHGVYEDGDGTTRVSEDVWPRDADCLFPLQAALGYQLAQTLFIGRRQVLVEGITDLWLLKAIDQALRDNARQGIRDDIVITPAGGAPKVFPLASLLLGHNVEVAALLDGDEPGRREGAKVKDKLLSDAPHRCIFLGDILRMQDAEIENLFPDEWVIAAAKQSYPSVDFTFTPDESTLPSIVERVTSALSRAGIPRLEKWRTGAVLRDRVLADPRGVPIEVLDRAEKVVSALNGLFPAA